MSEWQSPQDYPRRETDGVRRLVGAVESVSRQVRESTSNLLRTAGIYVTQQGMRIASSLRIEGDLEAAGSTTVGGTLDVTGDATFSGDTEIGGNARITGTLSLPAGIIDNDALASPVTFDAAWGYGSDYGTPSGAWTEVASATIVVPPGFTQMQFTAAGMANGLNGTSSTTNMYVEILRTVDGSTNYSSQQGQIALPAGFQGIASTFYLWNEAVSPGEVHRFALRVWTGSAFAASEYNYARLDVAALFGR